MMKMKEIYMNSNHLNRLNHFHCILVICNMGIYQVEGEFGKGDVVIIKNLIFHMKYRWEMEGLLSLIMIYVRYLLFCLGITITL